MLWAITMTWPAVMFARENASGALSRTHVAAGGGQSSAAVLDDEKDAANLG